MKSLFLLVLLCSAELISSFAVPANVEVDAESEAHADCAVDADSAAHANCAADADSAAHKNCAADADCEVQADSAVHADCAAHADSAEHADCTPNADCAADVEVKDWGAYCNATFPGLCETQSYSDGCHRYTFHGHAVGFCCAEWHCRARHCGHLASVNNHCTERALVCLSIHCNRALTTWIGGYRTCRSLEGGAIVRAVNGARLFVRGGAKA
ncbi:serine-aspartate repeat-containing protein I-like isoform X2 [Acipenser ruthenus]|uniref:serine-aspartate repeat-containing protein I-like isoform X2 n=1 Tax=Acipenser ruthenus TaxID=7906 RepID=UPI002740841A|nr:serine-aspartate repeat-containing protein I-like isoform X2 [Acipenser ruthenus]